MILWIDLRRRFLVINPSMVATAVMRATFLVAALEISIQVFHSQRGNLSVTPRIT